MRRDAKASSAGPTSNHGQLRALISLCLAIAGLLALYASPALAAQTHFYTGTSFGPDGVGGSESFEAVRSIAVDAANGDTYVYDAGAGKVYKFDSAGAPVNFSATGTNAISDVGGFAGGSSFEIALAPAGSPAATAGDIYLANNGSAIHVYSAAGAELGQVSQAGGACGVATDPSGNFYAGVAQTINKFTPTTNPPTENDKVGTGTAEQVQYGICNVAVDGLGNIYATGPYSASGLQKLEGLADTTPTVVDSVATTMAIAPGSNDLYADRFNEIVQYDSAGNRLGSFGGGEIGSASFGVAVNSDATKIYVGIENKVKVFGAATLVPDATTEAADPITKTVAVLHGSVGAAGGPDATCIFQYVTESEFNANGFEGASEVPCSPAGPFSGTATTAVSATASGLSSPTAYRFRVLATSSNGSFGGEALSFSTPGAVNVRTDPATNLTASSATLNGTINPEGVELEECSFEYRPSGFGSSFKSVPCAESPATIGSGNSPVAVHADLSELSGGTAYEFRLAGKSELGISEATLREFKTPGATVIGESITGVSETAATFHATLNPNGAATNFFFEYVTQAEFELNGFSNAAKVPAGGESAGAGTSNVEVSAQATGLVPQTAYRFRVVATNSGGASFGPGKSFTTRAPTSTFGTCPNDAFRTGPGALLPDCRAYERATPADKGGLDIEGFPDLLGAASDGSGVSFSSTGGSGTPAGGGGRQDVTTMFSSRVGDSWGTQRLLPPESLGVKAGYLGSSQDMRFSLVEAGDDGKSGLFLIDTSDESVTQLVPYQTEQGVPLKPFHCDAISDDGSWVFFESKAKLTPTAVASRPNLYMWSRATGEVSVAGVLPASEGGGSPSGGSFGGAYAWTSESTETGGSSNGQYVEAIHAASPDGDQIYFTARFTGQLYLRRGLDGGAPTTVAVSKPNEGVEDRYVEEELFGERFPAAFQEATPDGSRAFFISPEKLTADASTGEYDEGKDLYRYDRASDSLVDITGGLEGPENPNGARVQGLLGASADGSSGYFAAKGKLTSEAGTGTNNIYRFEEEGDGSFHLTYVGKAPGETASRNWSPYSYRGVVIADYYGKTSRVSADGATLVYSVNEQFVGGLRSEQIFVYRAADGKTTCISCDPTGSKSFGGAELTASFVNSNNFIIPNVAPAPRLTHSLSADGTRVFFQTPNALLGADTNSTPTCTYLVPPEGNISGLYLPNCTDVYEWEAVGAPGGSCTKVEFNGGCLYLLSTGKSEDASYFIDASSDGTSAFIATTSQLVPADRDQLYDIYDARTDGGLASQQFVAGAPCSGEACREGAAPPPASQSAGSASFQGPGNAKPAKHNRCNKGAKKKCAKKKKKKAHKHKHSDKRGHASSSKGDRK